MYRAAVAMAVGTFLHVENLGAKLHFAAHYLCACGMNAM